MRILALTSRRIESRKSGYDLRVANLCAHLPGEVHLVVAPFQARDGVHPGLPLAGVFDSVEELAPLRAERTGPRRHLRLSNSHFLELTRPAAVAAARARLAQVVREREITHIAVFGQEMAELVTDIARGPGSPRVLVDVCDSSALTAERAAAGATPPRGLGLLAHRLDVARKRRTELSLPDRFDLVTTINHADSRAVEGPYRAPGTVRTVPNGLDDAFAKTPLPPAGERRGVVFWGNLGFAPNHEALRFFVHDVFLPRLRDRDVELCVVGADAPSWLVELAEREPSVVLTGYASDLAATVSRYPIMINPMRTGSGLKNKVLEAFGLGLVVVSTPMGVEALPVAEEGIDYVGAGGAAEFGAAVVSLLDDRTRRSRLRSSARVLVERHYRWDAVGEQWRDLFDRELASVSRR